MSIALLTQKYEGQLYGVLHGYDKLVFSGNLHPFCYAQANHMAATWEMETLHQRLDALAWQYCPVVAQLVRFELLLEHHASLVCYRHRLQEPDHVIDPLHPPVVQSRAAASGVEVSDALSSLHKHLEVFAQLAQATCKHILGFDRRIRN